MTNEQRVKAFEAIGLTVELYKNGVKGESEWCRFAQGSFKLRARWKYYAFKAVQWIVIIAGVYYLIK